MDFSLKKKIRHFLKIGKTRKVKRKKKKLSSLKNVGGQHGESHRCSTLREWIKRVGWKFFIYSRCENFERIFFFTLFVLSFFFFSFYRIYCTILVRRSELSPNLYTRYVYSANNLNQVYIIIGKNYFTSKYSTISFNLFYPIVQFSFLSALLTKENRQIDMIVQYPIGIIKIS